MRDNRIISSALIVIDVQKGFISDKTEYVLPIIKEYIYEFKGDCIIATQFVNEGGGFESILHWNRLKDSPEIEVLDFVVEKSDYVVKKNLYSACSEEIIGILEENNIQEVYLIGIDTDCCVLKTAIDLFEMNKRPVVVARCCASNGGKESHEAALKVLSRTIGEAQIEF